MLLCGYGIEEGRYSVAERLEMAMCGRFETIRRGNVDVRVHGIERRDATA